VPASHWNRPLDLIRRARHGGAVLCAFELIELEGEDLRRPIENRKRKLSKLVRTPHTGIVLNEQYEGDGEIVFRLLARLRGHCVEVAWLAIPLRPGELLSEGQRPDGASGEARGRRRLGPVIPREPA
jgi:hypothetical protein